MPDASGDRGAPLPPGQTPAAYAYAVRPGDVVTLAVDDDFQGHSGMSSAVFVDRWPAEVVLVAHTPGQLFAARLPYRGAELVGRTLRLHTTFVRNPGTPATTRAVDRWTGGPRPLVVEQRGAFEGASVADTYRLVTFVAAGGREPDVA